MKKIWILFPVEVELNERGDVCATVNPSIFKLNLAQKVMPTFDNPVELLDVLELLKKKEK